MPVSLKAAIEASTAREAISLNQFIVMAAAEKLATIQGADPAAERFFAERRGRGDPDAAIRFLTREGGEPPRPGGELPPS
jgi:hypothetical protein